MSLGHSQSKQSAGESVSQRAAAEILPESHLANGPGELAVRLQHSPQEVAQRALSAQIYSSSHMKTQRTLVDGISAAQRTLADEVQPEKFVGDPLIQRQEAVAPKTNNTGLPDNLKSGIESLSGISMDGVKVHYNSPQPAQLNALAYAQGTDIHVAPGQEQHLPHEAWHVVQQAQGRVQPTMQMMESVPVNDDPGLEHEADVMGAKALQVPAKTGAASHLSTQAGSKATQLQLNRPVIQMARKGIKIGAWIGGALGTIGGIVGGALAGAAIGSTVPLIGTIVGAVLGGVVGGMLGTGLGAGIGHLASNPEGPQILNNDNMETGRRLAAYYQSLNMGTVKGPSLQQVLEGLDGDAVWADMGAGEAKAMRDLVSNLGNGEIPRLVAIGYTKPDSEALDEFIQQHLEKFVYLEGLLEDHQDEEISENGVDVITDVLGVASYSRDLHGAIDRYARLLKPGQHAFITIEKRYDRNTFLNGDDKSSPEVWLAKATGVDIAVKTWMNEWHIRLTRSMGNDLINIPALELVSYDETHPPPVRVFRF